MTETEKRRLKLLQDTRKAYSDNATPPAVHPRYQSAYRSLYPEEMPKAQGTFGIRLFLSILIFALFCAFSYQEKSFGNIDSQYVVQEIQREYLFR